MIGESLYEHLKDDAGITAIVGTKVRPLVASTKDVLPYLTFSQIGGDHVHHMASASGLAGPLFQIDCWETKALLAHTLADAVRESLDGNEHFTMGTVNTTFVSSAMLQGELDNVVTPTHGDEPSTYRVTQTWKFWHAETVPTF